MANSRSMKIIVLSTVAVIVLAVIGFIAFQPSSSVDSGVVYDTSPESDGQPIKGELDASVTITEFGDYKCPSCKAWEEDILPLLEEEYIDTGQVNLVHINTPFHGEESGLASLASESVWENHPEAFWQFHQAIYSEQPEVQNHDEAWITLEKLIEIANSVEEPIDLEVLATDIVEQTYVDNVQEDIAMLEQYEVEFTPTIMVDNIKVEDPFDYDVITQLIEEKLEERE